jgi:hypothetical protein
MPDSRMLEQIEIWPSGVVKGDDFAIDDSILGKVAERLDDVPVLSVE